MIPRALRNALEQELGERAAFDVPLARHTSLRVGGPADALVSPASPAEIARVFALCRQFDCPWSVLGSGFNTLVGDEGIDGVVLSMRKLRGLDLVKPGDASSAADSRHTDGRVRIRGEAGVSHSQISRFCASRALSGLEFAVGIPGTLGGWIAMNAGIGTREMKDVVESAEWITAAGDHVVCDHSNLGFRYRGLQGLPPRAAIVAATFALTPADEGEIRAEMRRLLDQRASTQPIDVPSCGSVFKNPEGDFAGRLVEAAGLKGLRAGGAEISGVHANFIVNRGDACAADVLALIDEVRSRVHETFGILLETEVRVIGRGTPAHTDPSPPSPQGLDS